MLNLEAMPRELLKKEASKRYRREGLIPSIIYGQGKNTNILIKSHAFKKMHAKLTRSTIIQLNLGTKNIDVLIKDYEKDYLRDEFIHLDFFELDPKKHVHVTVQLEFIGNAVGIREGGLLEKHLDKLVVSCLPKDIVPNFPVNIDNLKLNESLHVKDIVLDKKYKVLSHLDEVVVKISSSQKEEAVVAAPGAAPAAAEKTQPSEKSDKK